MSVIGPGNVGALNLASSVAGAQRNTADAGNVKQEASQRKFQIDRTEATAKSLEDVSETESSPERDADGRRLYTDAGNPIEQDGDEQHSASLSSVSNRRSPDAFEERGGALDLEA